MVRSTRDGVTGELVFLLDGVPTSVPWVPPALEHCEPSTVTSCIKGILGAGVDPCSSKVLILSDELVLVGGEVTFCIPTPLGRSKLLIDGCFNLASSRMVLGGVVVVVSGTRIWVAVWMVTLFA